MSGADGARTWTVLELLRWTTGYFTEHGIETPRLDAECLVADALGRSRLELYLEFDKPVTEPERARLREHVRRRAAERVPVALLTGTKEFWSLALRVSPEVLVPRPETETLVAAALELLPQKEGEYRVLDVGTGSGAVALALAHERPKACITATDLRPESLAVARENAEALGCADRLRWLEGSLYEPVAGERFDAVVSNPPYLATQDAADLAPELRHEPPEALFAGADGTDVLRPLVAGAAEALEPGGGFAVELSPEQAELVAAWCREAGLRDVTICPDLAKRPRVVQSRAAGGAAAQRAEGERSSSGWNPPSQASPMEAAEGQLRPTPAPAKRGTEWIASSSKAVAGSPARCAPRAPRTRPWR